MDLLTRRTYLASVAATLAASSNPAIAVIANLSPANAGERIPLYVHHECAGLLSLGKPSDDFSDIPDWTYGQRILSKFNGDAVAMDFDAYAKQEFSDWAGIDVADVDEQELARWLQEPLSDREAEDATEYWLNNCGPIAQAARLIESLGIAISEKDDDHSKDSIRIENDIYFGALVGDFGVTRGEQSLELLKNALAARGLQIEIIETC